MDYSSLVHINELPSEILEHIFSMLSPYTDQLTCKLVCKRWYQLVTATIIRRTREFKRCLLNNSVEWSQYYPLRGSFFSGRHSHCCVRVANLMYIFGGCTNGRTTFNDLWTLDLTTRFWIRPLISGTYPPPKACSSLVHYQNFLILFGGWTHNSHHPMSTLRKLFNDVHILDISRKVWSLVSPKGSHTITPMCGHGATVHKDRMIVFGGMVGINTLHCSNDVWSLDLINYTWSKLVTNKGPLPRYGHSQIALDDEKFMIIGGCGVLNTLYSDIWILDIKSGIWSAIRVIGDTPNSGFCNACKIDDFIILLGKSLCNDSKGHNKQLDVLRDIYRQMVNDICVPRCLVIPTRQMQYSNRSSIQLFIYQLNNTCLLSNSLKCVHTLNTKLGPNQHILYSSCVGKQEILIFGGIHVESNTLTNSFHILRPKIKV